VGIDLAKRTMEVCIPEGISKTTLRPLGSANFYTALLRWWIRNFEKGAYISVKFFDDGANLFLKVFPPPAVLMGNARPSIL
jgi:hypothetical protein